MKGEVELDEQKLSPTDQAQLKELKELYEQGAEYFKDSSTFMLWHIGFYAAALACLVADLTLPSAFGLAVAIFFLVQHIRYRGKAKKIAYQIMQLEDEIFSRAMREALRTFKEIMHNERAKPKVTRKRRGTDSNSDNSPSSIRLDKSGNVTEPDNPGWYKPERKE